MEKKLVKIYIIAVVLVVLVFALYLMYKNTSYQSEQIIKQESLNNEGSTSQPSQTQTQILSYNDAVRLYTNRRIQFDENCVVNPSNVTFKKGTKIMLDNRASKQRSVYLDDQLYTLKAYGFKIVTLTTTAKLPHTIRIDCGTGKNNGSILLQQ